MFFGKVPGFDYLHNLFVLPLEFLLHERLEHLHKPLKLGLGELLVLDELEEQYPHPSQKHRLLY